MDKPIDPNNKVAILNRFEASSGTTATRRTIAGALTVARAVCPDGYVVVPVKQLEAAINALHELWDISGGLHSVVMHDGDTDHRAHWLNEYDTKADDIHETWERLFDLLATEGK